MSDPYIIKPTEHILKSSQFNFVIILLASDIMYNAYCAHRPLYNDCGTSPKQGESIYFAEVLIHKYLK